MLSQIENIAGPAAKLQIWYGTIPPDCQTNISTQVMLAQFSLSNDWLSTPSAGVAAFNNAPLSTTAVCYWNCHIFRLVSAGGICAIQGSIGLSNSDLLVDNLSINSGQTLNVSWMGNYCPNP